MNKKALLLKVPKERYLKFKNYCASKGETMTGTINQYIKKVVGEDND